MTAAAHALGVPVPTRRPRVDTVDVCPQPITRQDRARRVMLKVAGGLLGAVVVATGQQVAAHGLRAFVFRAPGVGGTPAADAAATGARQVPVGPSNATSGTGLAPAATDHNAHRPPPGQPPRGQSHRNGAARMTRFSGTGDPAHGASVTNPGHGGPSTPPVIHVPAAPPSDPPSNPPSASRFPP